MIVDRTLAPVVGGRVEVVAQSLAVAVGEVGTEGGVKVARAVVAVGVVIRVVAKVFVVIAVGPAANEWGWQYTLYTQ